MPTLLFQHLRSLYSLRFLFCLALVGVSARPGWAAKWQPIDAAEFAQTKSAIDPEAGAEIIFDESEFNNEDGNSTEVTRYVRARIYGERGVEKFTKVEIPFAKGTKVSGVAARTITPDGRIVELDPKDVYEREVLKAGNTRVRVKAFAPPGLVANCIVEYRYAESRNQPLYRIAMVFRHVIPTRLTHYRVRMMQFPGINHDLLAFNSPPQKLKEDKRGFYNFEFRNQPATTEEPFSPPDINTQPVVVLYLSFRTSDDPKVYWKEQAKALHDRLQDEASNGRVVKTALSTIVASADDPETKLRKIYAYCRTKIANRERENAQFSSEQKKKFKNNESASDTLKRDNGTSEDINLVFAALANSAGFDAHLALCNDRRWILYSSKITAPFLFTDSAVAIRSGKEWRFFDPGSTYLPFAQLNWFNCHTMALVSNPKEAEVVEVVSPPSSFSRRDRKGNFTLDTDGTLEGDVVITYTGLFAAQRRPDFENQSAEERTTSLRESLQATLKLAEVSEVEIENAVDAEADLRLKFHLRVPEYAERTGSRLFLLPAVFQKNLHPIFDAPTRSTMIMFPYANVEHDEITIQPPEGFALESASSPGNLDMGALGKYTTTIKYKKKSGLLVYERTATLDGLTVLKEGYPSVKAAFDSIHAKDNHVLTLKQAPAATPAQAEKPVATVSAAATATP